MVPATLSMSLPPAGPVPVRISLRTSSGCLTHEGLGDHAAEGEGEDVDLVEAERLDEGVGVVGHRLDAVGNLAGGGADTAVVEGDDVVVLRDGVDDPRVPVVQGRGEVDEEDDGDAALRAQLAVGVGDAAGGDGAGRRFGIGGDDGFVRCLWVFMTVLLVTWLAVPVMVRCDGSGVADDGLATDAALLQATGGPRRSGRRRRPVRRPGAARRRRRGR